MMPGTDEELLVKNQLRHNTTIFACNEYVVIARRAVFIGHDHCGRKVETWVNDVPKVSMGKNGVQGEKTNSYLNTWTFIVAWDTLIMSGRLWNHDFIVKVDPDTVFFPDRLRPYMEKHVGQCSYFRNCWLDEEVGKRGGLLYGSLEVYSKQAIGMYHEFNETCKSMKWRGWGEDLYMQKCMDKLHVPRKEGFFLIRDAMCNFPPCHPCDAPCTQNDRVSFHPFKTNASWWKCWREASQ